MAGNPSIIILASQCTMSWISACNAKAAKQNTDWQIFRQRMGSNADICVTIQNPHSFSAANQIMAGVLFGVQDVNNAYGFAICPCGTGAVLVIKNGQIDYDPNHMPTPWTNSPAVRTDPGAQNMLRVNISNGVITHPNLVRFRGYVARSGAVRASATVQDKYASRSGRLSRNSGRGTWSGYSGGARCSGYWTAARN